MPDLLPALIHALPALAVIGLAVLAILKGADARLVLLGAGLLLATMSGQPWVIVYAFFKSMVDEGFVIPICCTLGFSHVLKQTGCDKDLVLLLTRPLEHVRPLLVPGAILVGFVVNIPLVSQTGTVAAVGSVLVPLLSAAGVPPITVGSALLLGSSIGGELLNRGGTDYAALSGHTLPGSQEHFDPGLAYGTAVELSLIQLAVATSLFWWLHRRSRWPHLAALGSASSTAAAAPRASAEFQEATPAHELPVHAAWLTWLRAAVPVVPLAILFVTGEPLNLWPIPSGWLLPNAQGSYEGRLVGGAMVIGTITAAMVALLSPGGRQGALQSGRAFFDGAGYAYKEVIALIVAATCFAEGVKCSPLFVLFKLVVNEAPDGLLPAAACITMAVAFTSGSGLGAVRGMFGVYLEVTKLHAVPVGRLGALTITGAAAGRTMSPVAAVTLLSAKLTGTQPMELVKQVWLPIICGLTAATLYGWLV